jgi:hypothetical protein
MTIRGHVRKGCLWQLMEHGQLGAKQLADLIGSDANTIFGAVHHLMGKQLVIADPKKVRIDGARSVVVYGLSRAGIEQALALEPEDATADGIPAELM